MSWTVPFADVALRLLAAAIAGMILGVDRKLAGKPAGMRTLGLVSLGAAVVAIATIEFADMERHPDALSRVIQGIIQGVLTGVGFIGAGVILQRERRGDVEGLTTAATIWVAAAMGIACALAAWWVVAVGLIASIVLLLALTPLDAWLFKLGNGDSDKS